MKFLLMVRLSAVDRAQPLGHVDLAFAPPIHSIVRVEERSFVVTSVHLVLVEREPGEFAATGQGQVWLEELV